MRVNRRRGGFSLVEVATSLGVISFALVALIGVFPLGLENTRTCVAETRATQLVKMVSATLQSDTSRAPSPTDTADTLRGRMFTSADFFSPASTPLAPLDLTALGGTDALAATPDVTLYASYDVRDLPRVVRAVQSPTEAIYRVELRFRRELFTPLAGGSTARVVGTNVNLKIFTIKDKKAFAESWIYLPNFAQK